MSFSLQDEQLFVSYFILYINGQTCFAIREGKIQGENCSSFQQVLAMLP